MPTVNAELESELGDHPSDISARIEIIFADRLFVDMDELAAILSIEVKTLRALVNSGRIACVVLGTGLTRPRRRFTREHVIAFLRAPTPVGSSGSGAIDADRVRAAVRRRVAAARS